VKSLKREFRAALDEYMGRTGKRLSVERGGKHMRVVDGSGAWMPAPISASDWRAIKNFRANLRRTFGTH
jgi:hypothetical protein